MDKTIYLATTSERFIKMHITNKEIIATPYDNLIPETGRYMGLASDDNFIYLGSDTKICKFDKKTLERTKFIWFTDENPSLHHMEIVNDKLYVSSAFYNRIYELNLDLKIISYIDIDPGKHTGRGNHVNGIFHCNNQYYVSLNQLERKFGMSGIAVLDSNFEEIDRFEYGWHMHGFAIIDEKYYALCNNLENDNNIYHPHISGLLVDNKIVFEYSSKWFCKDLSIDNDYIYLVGGDSVSRDKRIFSDGILFILNRDFKLIKEIRIEGAGEFIGCLLDKNDLSFGEN